MAQATRRQATRPNPSNAEIGTRRDRPLPYPEQLPRNNYRLQHVREESIDVFNVDSIVPVVVTEWSDPLDCLQPQPDPNNDDETFADPYDSSADSDADDEH